jgi:hypothetical protein
MDDFMWTPDQPMHAWLARHGDLMRLHHLRVSMNNSTMRIPVVVVKLEHEIVGSILCMIG